MGIIDKNLLFGQKEHLSDECSFVGKGRVLSIPLPHVEVVTTLQDCLFNRQYDTRPSWQEC